MNNITTLKPKAGVELLAIVVDKDCEYDIDVAGYTNLYNLTKGKSDIIISNKEEKYSILGCVEYNKAIEFDCDGLVESKEIDVFDEGWFKDTYYKNYNEPDELFELCADQFLFKNDSFISLLEANNINLQQLDKENKKLVILIKQ